MRSSILLLLLFFLFPSPAYAAAGAAVMEINSGTLLYAENGDTPLPPASTTKIMTALLTLSLQPDMSGDHVISSRAAAVGESSIALQAGESLNLTELLTGALIHSGNDACFAAAEAVAGDEDLFVHWMNMKAMVLGAYSAAFYNTNGLPHDRHVISADDMCRITAAAMEEPFFRETVKQKYASLGEGEHYRYYKNTNKLLWQDEHIVGVKTGTTDAAGPCLVAAYGDGAACFVSTVFNSPDRYGESLTMLQNAAQGYILLFLLERGKPYAAVNGEVLYAAGDLQVLLERPAADGLRLRWELWDGGGRVSLLDGEGHMLSVIPLEKKAL